MVLTVQEPGELIHEFDVAKVYNESCGGQALACTTVAARESGTIYIEIVSSEDVLWARALSAPRVGSTGQPMYGTCTMCSW